ncbi:MAG: CinA family protein [Lentisphaerae bacterium]|nr:CinA family protein [Lentisphaerota bacterium]
MSSGDGKPEAEAAGRLLRAAGATLAVAESCTGGLLGGAVTSVPGSSAYFAGGIVAYADAVKQRELGVPAALLERDGAVSEGAARAMACGVRERFGTTIGLSVTGIAGPGGGSREKPVGLVYIGLADGRGCRVREHRFKGTRGAIREAACRAALVRVAEYCEGRDV